MIARVISGGQNGVDLAALLAAEERGVPTGGTMPRGWRTLDGPRPEYEARFGMTEHKSPTYMPRTRANVEEADFTLRIAADFDSAGERCTLRCVSERMGYHFDVLVSRNLIWYAWDFLDVDVSRAILRITLRARYLNRPIVLNVAGNSERTATGIGVVARVIVGRILDGTKVAQ